MPGVRVLGPLHNLGGFSGLDDLPLLHDAQPVGQPAHDAHVVGDEQDRHAQPSLQAHQQLQQLRLDGHVQGGGGLVRDEQIRLVGQGHGDHHPLPLSAGQLVRVGAEPPLGILDADEPQQFHRARGGRRPVEALVQLQGLADLALDGVERVQRRHGLLENHGDTVAADALQGPGVGAQQFGALEADAAARMAGGGVGQQLQDRQRGGRFARAAFSHQGHGLAPADGKGDPVHGFHRSRPGAEADRQVFDGHQRRAGSRSGAGSGVPLVVRRGCGHVVFGAGFGREGLARVEGVAHGLADEHQQAQHDRDDQESGETEPGRLQVVLPLLEQLAQGGGPRRQAETEEVQGGERHHRAAGDERKESQRRHHGVGQHVAGDDARVAYPQRPRRPHVVEVARAQELGPHHAHQRHPAKQQHERQQPPEARGHHAGQDDQQVEGRQPRPHFDEALEEEVEPAAEVALDGARGDADHRAHQGEDQAEQHRDAESVDQPGGDVPRLVVGAEPVPDARRRRRGRRQVEGDGVVAVADGRPQDPAALLDERRDLGVAVVGIGLQEAAELRFRIVHQHRHVERPVVAHQQRPVVGDELGEEAYEQQRAEDQERPVPAPVGAKVVQASSVERRHARGSGVAVRSPGSRSRCAGPPPRR